MKRLLVITLLLLATLLHAPAQAERVKDLAQVAGVRGNPLIGYGLVVGLDGSGDRTSQTPFTVQSLKTMLEQLGAYTEAIEAPFQPEHGAYGGGHHHSRAGEEDFNYAPRLHQFGVRL